MKKQSIVIIALMLGFTFAVALEFGGVTSFGASLGAILPFNFNGGANIDSPDFPTFNGISEFNDQSNYKTYFDRDVQAQLLADSYPLIDGGLGYDTQSTTVLIHGNDFDLESGVNSTDPLTTSDFEVYKGGCDITKRGPKCHRDDGGEAVAKGHNKKTNDPHPSGGDHWVIDFGDNAKGINVSSSFGSTDLRDLESALSVVDLSNIGALQNGTYVVQSTEGTYYRMLVKAVADDVTIVYDYVYMFSISSNDDFALNTLTYGWSGSGLASDPYVISGYTLSMHNVGFLNVYNTDVHFTFSDNTGYGQTSDVKAINLVNVQNAAFSGNLISGYGQGASLSNSPSASFSGNSFSDNALQGLYAVSSDGVSSSGDTFSRNGGSGVIFENSVSVSVDQGTFTSNGLLASTYTTYITAGAGLVNSDGSVTDSSFTQGAGNGVLVFGSFGATVSGNTISGNSANGVAVISSDNVNVLSNTITLNNKNGVLLSSTAYSLIEGNSVTWNGEDGVSFINSSFNKVLYNDLSNNSNVVLQAQKTDGLVRTLRYGLFLDPSYKNEIAYNNITENGFGIKLEDSDENNIHHNFVSSNAQDGLFVENSDDNVIDSNVFSGNSDPYVQAFFLAHMKPGTFSRTLRYGLFLDPSSGNTVTNNVVEDNYGIGIYVQLSDGNTIDGNTVSGNALDGIFVEDSHYNNITNNDFSFNSNPVLQTEFMSVLKPEGMTRTLRYGLFLDPSTNNLVKGNTFSNEYGTGIGVLGSDNNEIDSNTITNSGGDGVSVIDSDANKITNNEITGSSNPEMLSAFLSYGKPEGITRTLRYGLFLDPSSGNDVSGNTVTNNYGGGLMVESSDGNSFDGNSFSGNGYEGAAFINSSYNTFTNNNLDSNSNAVLQMELNSVLNEYKPNSFTYTLRYGLFLDPSNYNTISGNTISNTPGYGIWLQLSDNNIIDSNAVFNNGLDGVFVEDSDYNTISNNGIFDNGNDAVLSSFLNYGKPEGFTYTLRYGLFLDPSTGNQVSGNYIANNNGHGVGAFLSDNNAFVGNTIAYNTLSGIFVTDSDGLIVNQNSVVFNDGYGAAFDGLSTASQVSGNDFVGNSEYNIYDDGGNTFDSNFLLDANPYTSYFVAGNANSTDPTPSSTAFTDLSKLDFDPVEITAKLTANTLNVRASGNYMDAHIYFPAGYSAYLVNTSTVYAEWNGNIYPMTYVSPSDLSDLHVKFDRQALSSDIIDFYGPDFPDVEITVSFHGQFGDFLDWYGSDSILATY